MSKNLFSNMYMQPNTEMCRQYIIIEFRPIYSKKIFDFILFAIHITNKLPVIDSIKNVIQFAYSILYLIVIYGGFWQNIITNSRITQYTPPTTLRTAFLDNYTCV